MQEHHTTVLMSATQRHEQPPQAMVVRVRTPELKDFGPCLEEDGSAYVDLKVPMLLGTYTHQSDLEHWLVLSCFLDEVRDENSHTSEILRQESEPDFQLRWYQSLVGTLQWRPEAPFDLRKFEFFLPRQLQLDIIETQPNMTQALRPRLCPAAVRRTSNAHFQLFIYL